MKTDRPQACGSEEFLGRQGELAILEASWRAPGGAFVPIYGRRRVGKSELILHFLRDRPAIYHIGKVAPAELQLRELLDEAARALGQPLLAQVAATTGAPRSRRSIMRGRGPEQADHRARRVPVDAGASPELPSVLQELWDRRWKRGRVMLILCGSMIGFMEREVLGAKSPLFGRRTAQIRLAPFGCGRLQRFTRDGRAPTRHACDLSSAEWRAICVRSSRADRSSRTSQTTCCPNSPHCSASPNSFFARSSERSAATRRC